MTFQGLPGLLRDTWEFKVLGTISPKKQIETAKKTVASARVPQVQYSLGLREFKVYHVGPVSCIKLFTSL